jgi:hypothetical protein
MLDLAQDRGRSVQQQSHARSNYATRCFAQACAASLDFKWTHGQAHALTQHEPDSAGRQDGPGALRAGVHAVRLCIACGSNGQRWSARRRPRRCVLCRENGLQGLSSSTPPLPFSHPHFPLRTPSPPPPGTRSLGIQERLLHVRESRALGAVVHAESMLVWQCLHVGWCGVMCADSRMEGVSRAVWVKGWRELDRV